MRRFLRRVSSPPIGLRGFAHARTGRNLPEHGQPHRNPVILSRPPLGDIDLDQLLSRGAYGMPIMQRLGFQGAFIENLCGTEDGLDGRGICCMEGCGQSDHERCEECWSKFYLRSTLFRLGGQHTSRFINRGVAEERRIAGSEIIQILCARYSCW